MRIPSVPLAINKPYGEFFTISRSRRRSRSNQHAQCTRARPKLRPHNLKSRSPFCRQSSPTSSKGWETPVEVSVCIRPKIFLQSPRNLLLRQDCLEKPAAYDLIRLHTSAYVSIRHDDQAVGGSKLPTSPYTCVYKSMYLCVCERECEYIYMSVPYTIHPREVPDRNRQQSRRSPRQGLTHRS